MPPTLKKTRVTNWDKTRFYAYVSLTTFLCAIGLFALLRWQHGLMSDQAYYLVLILFGLFSSAFLFGVFSSYAAYSGNSIHGSLRLGGPVVCFVLVVAGGMHFTANESFAVTVYAHGPKGQHDIVLRDSGIVLLDVGRDRRSESIGGKGEAHFSEIPSRFVGQEAVVSIQAPLYEGAQTVKLDQASIYLLVRPKMSAVRGYVRDASNSPLAGANVDFDGQSVSSNPNGFFEIPIPITTGARVLTVKAGGKVWQAMATPGANDITAVVR